MEEAIARHPDIALFSAGGGTPLNNFALRPRPVATVIDNSSAWRMDPTRSWWCRRSTARPSRPTTASSPTPLQYHHSNGHGVGTVAQEYIVSRVVVSTYQSVTGTGQKAVKQMHNERSGGWRESPPVRHRPQRVTVVMYSPTTVYQGGDEDGEREERSSSFGSASRPPLRVPVTGGHSEAVNVEFAREFDIDTMSVALREVGDRTVRRPGQ